MKPEELETILDNHKKWLNGVGNGKRADLQSANLQSANLQSADLQSAHLRGANLQSANLQSANLRGADLQSANLRGADLQSANLQSVNLQSANLRGANLRGANLRGALNSELTLAQTIVTNEGDIVGYKKCLNGVIVKLLIPIEAKRSNANGRKCRAEYVKVLEIYGFDIAISQWDIKTTYKVGEITRPSSWDEDRWNECSEGIHFFLTKVEAENY